MKFRAVIFDLDGTLLDSLAGIADAMNILLARYGYPGHPLHDYRCFVGSGLEEMVRRSLPQEPHNPKEMERWVREYREIYEETWPAKSLPYPGILELLDQLDKKKIATAVLSNKSELFTEKMAASLLPGHDFALVRGARPGVAHKPDPGAALEIAAMLGIPPAQFIFLGDSGIDMETANNAGMYPVGALWGFRDAEELVEHGAKQLIAHPGELLHLFKN